MRTRFTAAFVSILGLFYFASIGMAEDEAESERLEYSRRGGYVGAGALYGFSDFDLVKLPGSGRNASDSWGFDVRAGYRYPYVAGEVQFQYFDEFALNASGNPVARQDAQAFSVNLKGFPLNQGPFQPYGLVGIGFMRLASDARGQGVNRTRGEMLIAEPGRNSEEFIARFGAGIDAYLTPKIVFYVEGSYILPVGELQDFPIIPLAWGVQYRFD